MKKILVTGVNGQLGYDVVQELDKRGYESIGVDREVMNLTNSEEIRRVLNDISPDAVIHCAAYTAVDAAEDNIELCERVNALAVKDIAECAKYLDIPMIYISTDYVFNGMKGINQNNVDEVAYTIEDNNICKECYLEYTEDDKVNPINVYGRTKYEGERYVRDILDKHYIVRISWVFGENGNNFIDTMLRLSKDRDELNVIDDQVGSPTYTKDLAPLLVDMLESDRYGTYHATNDGYCSWYEFAKEIFDVAGVDIKVNPITTDMYPTKAKRPFNSKMSKEKLKNNNFRTLRSWKSAVKDYIENIK